MHEQRDGRPGDDLTRPYALGGADDTRVYDFGGFSGEFHPAAADPREPGDRRRREHPTDELDLTAVMPAVHAPDPAPSAPPAAPEPAPTPAALFPSAEPGPRPGWIAAPVDVVRRLETSARGPRAWERLLSLLLALPAIAVLALFVWDGTRAAVGEAVAVPWLMERTGLGIDGIGIAVTGAAAGLLLVIGLTLGWSGLGAGIGGFLMALFGVILFFLASRESALQAMALSGAALLVVLGAALVGAGIGAHFARRGGYRRALRIARDATRM